MLDQNGQASAVVDATSIVPRFRPTATGEQGFTLQRRKEALREVIPPQEIA